MLFKEIITVFFENIMKQLNTQCGQNAALLIANPDGTYSNHQTLKLNLHSLININYK